MKKLSDWEMKTGSELLKKVGIKKGDVVLDFGCNDGNYTIPAAKIVGEKGSIFAIDKDNSYFDLINNKARIMELENIDMIDTSGELKFYFDDNFFDFVMLYDVLHYLKFSDRNILYKEIFRIVKYDAILSVYPKHTSGNFPLMELRNVSVDDLIVEIEDYKFVFSQKICDELSHDGHLENGCVLNFTKNKQRL